MKHLASYLAALAVAVPLLVDPRRSFVADVAGEQVAQVYVQPYVRSDGTQVRGHMRSAADGNPYNNYSFPDNRNPYTGNVAGGNVDSYLRNHGGGAGASEPHHTWEWKQ